MSYPVDIPPTVTGYSLGLNGSRGRHSFEHGSAFYEFLARDNPGSGDLKIHALKSTDNGNTWTEMDSANAPTSVPDSGLVGGLGDVYTVAVDGDSVIVVVLRATASPTTIHGLEVTIFDLVTDTWGTPTDYSSPVPDGANTSAFQYILELSVIGAGNYQLMYSGPRETITGTKWGRVYTVAFDGSTFGTPVALPGQSGIAANFAACSAVAYGGVNHYFYKSNESGSIGSPLYHVALDTDGVTFGTVAKVTDDLYWVSSDSGVQDIGQCSEAIIAQVGGVDVLAIAAEINDDVSSTTQSLRVFYATPALNPTWSNTIASQAEDGDPELPRNDSSFWVPAFVTLGYANGNMVVSWPWQNHFTTSTSRYRYTTSSTASFSWTAPADLFAPSISGVTSVSVIALNGSSGVGITGLGLNTNTDDDFLAQFYFLPFGTVLINCIDGPLAWSTAQNIIG